VERPRAIVEPYLRWLQREFGPIAEAVESLRISSDAATSFTFANARLRDQFIGIAPTVLERARAFWSENGERAAAVAKALPGMKATFGGDIGPQRGFKQLERAGLYFDTIVVQDPLLRIARIPGRMMPSERARLVLKYGLELVWQSPLYLAEVEPPIAVLVPDRELGGLDPQFAARWAETEPWAVQYWSKVLGREFRSYAEVETFVTSLKTIGAVLDCVKVPALFRMNADAPLDPHSQWNAFVEMGRVTFEEMAASAFDNPVFLLVAVRSRLMMASDILNTAAGYNAHPLIGAPLSYHYTCWRGQVVEDQVSGEAGTALHAELVKTNALLGTGLDWLGNVSEEELVELRRKGRLEDVRTLLRTNSERFSGLAVGDIEQVSREIDHNLEQGFRRHRDEVKEREAEFKKDLAAKGGGLLVSAVAAMQPLVLPAVPSWLMGVLGVTGVGSTAMDLGKAITKYVKEKGRLAATPIAILLDAKEKAD
jgi:hypothetical protein